MLLKLVQRLASLQHYPPARNFKPLQQSICEDNNDDGITTTTTTTTSNQPINNTADNERRTKLNNINNIHSNYHRPTNYEPSSLSTITSSTASAKKGQFSASAGTIETNNIQHEQQKNHQLLQQQETPPPPPPTPNEERSCSSSSGGIVNEKHENDNESRVAAATENTKDKYRSAANEMGSNVSRHSGKGLSGRRTQSSGMWSYINTYCLLYKLTYKFFVILFIRCAHVIPCGCKGFRILLLFMSSHDHILHV